MMLRKYNFGNTHVSLGTRTKTKPGNQISKILNILKQLENISMNTDSPHSAGRRTPPRAAFIMSNDKLDSQFVHGESPSPAYVSSATLQEPRPASNNDNVISSVFSSVGSRTLRENRREPMPREERPHSTPFPSRDMAGDCFAGIRNKPMAASSTTSFAAANSASDCTTSTLASEVHQRHFQDSNNAFPPRPWKEDFGVRPHSGIPFLETLT
jgi:hypothetical protein